jgi:hypothetical protein
VLVRDAGWLIQTAQGPVTRHLRPYLELADKIADSFSAADRLAIHKAGARLGGGHLRSQLCYQAWKTDRPLDDPHNFAFTRNSNSMDNALLVRDLVPLLDAYQQVCGEPDAEGRLDLADAILQGLSADPELLVTRLDLLTPCTMIEDLFIDRGENGRARYTSMGEAHVQLLGRYGELIGRLATSLKADAVTFDPAQRAYSPHGLAYGFCADILSNLAVRALYSQPSFGLSLEDVFVSRGHLDDKLAQARGWAALPRGEGERAHFDHSMERAEQSFARLMQALDDRASHPTRANASKFPDGKLYVVPEGVSEESVPGGFVPDGIVRAEEHCFTSDMKRGLESAATAVPKSHMLNDRKEGRFLTSAESGGTWFGISKVLLTLITSQGQDALLTGVPPAAVEVLPLTCPGLVVLLPA